ncbi:MAG TPA: D-alanyl-D-alanine carboxypeptidase family protein [Candidatus Limnocylindrales bacterium]|nr:D-alanyl-D-alanine carboxypeptidase family protein [Candidatus Limnocylindrales bacterium]
MPLRVLQLVLAVALGAGSALALDPAPAHAATFSDIADSKFRADIEWLAAAGLTKGCGDGKYCPDAVVTRGQMATFLVRMFGYTAQPSSDPFSDDNGTLHEPRINILYASGITSGCAPSRFCPNAAVSRGQMATFLSRALGLRFGAGNDYFADDDGTKHEINLDRLFFAGVTRGCGSGDRVCPNGSVTRGQMAAFLRRAAAPAPIAVPGVSDAVTHSTPITLSFTGPARFRGVTFGSDGASASLAKTFGTIVPAGAKADRTQLVSGVRYARLVDGPMAGAWIKVDGTLTRALGRAPAPPTCRYDDILTSRRAYEQHPITLLDTIYMLPSTYAPGDLSDTGNYALNGGYRVRSIIGSDLAAMARDARAAGAPIQVVSAYRSYAQQEATFNHWVSVGGYEHALLTSARPGHSEHQLGTTIDVTSEGGAAPWNYADWATTAAGSWMKNNAWKYGFVMTYPKGKTSVSCYDYESWHYRYVGKPIAAAVRSSGMTLREAIWAAYGP